MLLLKKMKKGISLLYFLLFWGILLFAQDDNIVKIDRNTIDLISHYLCILLVTVALGFIGSTALKKAPKKFCDTLKIIFVLLCFLPFFIFVVIFSIDPDYLSKFIDICLAIYPGSWYVFKDFNSKIDNSVRVEGNGNIFVNNEGGNVQIGKNNKNE